MIDGDALFTGRRLLGETGSLLWDRLTGSVTPIPVQARDIDPGWLTRAVQGRFPGVRVRRVEVIDRDSGTTNRVRLAVTYAAAGSGDIPPASMFIKFAPADFKTRLFVNLMQLGTNEVRFYRDVAAELPVDIPQVFHAGLGGSAQRFVLVLEDLAARGARFTNVAEHLRLDEARRVVQAFAHLHAQFWDSPRLWTDLAWLRSHARNDQYPIERFLSRVALARGARRFPDVVPRALVDAIPRLIAGRDGLEADWAQGPLTLIHGDAHVGNLYFLADRVGFLDWQVVQCGQGMRDVSYFLINSVPTELRRAHAPELIELYLATLATHGVAPLAFAAAWEQLRRHALYTWIAAAVTAAAATLQAAPIMRAGLARSSTAVMDLEALGCLDR